MFRVIGPRTPPLALGGPRTPPLGPGGPRTPPLALGGKSSSLTGRGSFTNVDEGISCNTERQHWPTFRHFDRVAAVCLVLRQAVRAVGAMGFQHMGKPLSPAARSAI